MICNTSISESTSSQKEEERMATRAYFFQPISCSYHHNLHKNNTRKALPDIRLRWRAPCLATMQSHDAKNIQRRSANFQPSSWSHEFIESIVNSTDLKGMEVAKESIESLDEKVKFMLENEGVNPMALLELIDDIHRLGLEYRFKEDTNRGLERILQSSDEVKQKIQQSVHGCALYFRVIRQHGYQVSADVFDSFKDSNGHFSTALVPDVEDMLSLYEAFYLAFDGDTSLEEAKTFSRFHLENIDLAKMDMNTARRVSHALELPFHHRMQRLEARWNVQTYNCKPSHGHHQLLHTLAKLDFNSVQFTHQQDLQELSRWWRDVGLANKLSFARDRLMECFFWEIGMAFEPQYTKCRKAITKAFKLITIIDDIYDVYGSLEELELFTDAVDKWDINAVSLLPDYMKLCFLVLYNTINDMAYDTLKDHGQDIIPHLRKVWADLCKAFLQEAKWSYKKHIPKFDEYLDHGWVSSSGVVLLTHAYFSMTPNITKEAMKSLSASHGLLRFPCTIFRLANDLNSSRTDIERGETFKAISCFMHETGESQEVARSYIRKLIDENWKMMNKEMVYNSVFGKPFIEIAANLARIALCQYQYGDAHSTPNDVSRNRVLSVIVEPIQLLEQERSIIN